ncbi:MAG: hypothetical protein AB1757_20235 [Acidobacteriota bacterium]
MSKKPLAGFITISLIFLSVSASYAFFSGTATATGTNENLDTAKYAEIIEKRGTGGLEILGVEIKNKFGRVKNNSWRVVEGKTSSSPTLEFTPPLEKDDYVHIDLKTGNGGDHGYLDLKFTNKL